MRVIYSQDVEKVSLYIKLKDQIPQAELDKAKGMNARKVSMLKAQSKSNMLNLPPTKSSAQITLSEPIANLGLDGRIDDSIICNVFNQRHFPEETQAYMNFKQQEKMIVNLMQCIIQSGHGRFQEYVKEQLLMTFLKVESKTKFRNKGLYHLLGLFGKDVENLVKQKRNR